MPKVYNKKNKDAPKGAVYVGRPTKWGNPYTIGGNYLGGDSREDVVRMYRYYLGDRPELREDIKKELKGKDLVCWCAPKACHADVLLEIANS